MDLLMGMNKQAEKLSEQDIIAEPLCNMAI